LKNYIYIRFSTNRRIMFKIATYKEDRSGDILDK